MCAKLLPDAEAEGHGLIALRDASSIQSTFHSGSAGPYLTLWFVLKSIRILAGKVCCACMELRHAAVGYPHRFVFELGIRPRILVRDPHLQRDPTIFCTSNLLIRPPEIIHTGEFF